jgi:hypothetical protein
MAVAEKVISYGVKEEMPGKMAEAAIEKLDPPIQAVIDECKMKLEKATEKYQKQLVQLETIAKQAAEGKNGAAPLAAEPISQFFGITYQWWNLLMLGPFQFVAPGGPFRPSKIIRHGDFAFMLAALWRNPVPMPGGANPSAAQIMAPFQYQIRGEVINLSTVTNGPDFLPVGGAFGGGFINIHFMPIPVLPPGLAPVEGNPVLCEANFTVDILGVGPGLPPFAGFSTWLYDPDREPPFVIPQIFIPGIGVIPVPMPGVAPGLQHDTPARYLVYV